MSESTDKRSQLPPIIQKVTGEIAWYLPRLPRIAQDKLLRGIAFVVSKLPDGTYAGIRAFTSTMELTPELVITNACLGAFPMGGRGKKVVWRTSKTRGILPLEQFHIEKNLKSFLRKNVYEVKFDTDFRGVLKNCADREGTWLTAHIQDVYAQLHDMGYAHSMEAWEDGKLVGGGFGVSVGRDIFDVNSMFHYAKNAGKVATVGLVEQLRASGFKYIDCEMLTPHWQALGAYEIPREEYLRLVTRSMMTVHTFDFKFDGAAASTTG